MSELYGPFNSGSGANFDETLWRETFGNLFTPGIVKGAKVSGSAGGDCAGSIPGTGLTVNIGTGAAFVYGFAYENTTSLAKTLANRDTTLDRIDRLVVRMNFAARTVNVQILQGSLAASPSPPALTQTSTTWEVPICRVYVAHNANPTANLAAGDLTNERVYAGVIGLSSQGSGSGLDADMVDGYHAANSSGGVPLSNGTLNNNLNADKLDGYDASHNTGSIPISDGTVNTDLNADKLDGNHGSAFILGATATSHVIVKTTQPTDSDGVDGDIVLWY